MTGPRWRAPPWRGALLRGALLRGALLRGALTALGLVAAWQGAVMATAVPAYILPAPLAVLRALADRPGLFATHLVPTLIEIVAGLGLGVLLGAASALAIARFAAMRRWLLPVLVISQAVPVFAIAPLLVLWLGYGLLSKIVMAALVIFFPVALALHDGLRRTEPGWLDLARVMNAPPRSVLLHLRLPAALPALASGLRVAAGIAPIGAVVGEWVGASAGLGYLMMQSLARAQTDVAFAALLLLALLGWLLWRLVDRAAARLARWQPERSGL